MLSGAKFALILAAVFFLGEAQAKDLHILVLGGSAAANCNAFAYPQASGVYQIVGAGDVKPASDPFEGSDCRGGSLWIPLGAELVKSHYADRVVFMLLTVAGSEVRDWLPGGSAFDKLQAAAKLTKARNYRFDYALWQQGRAEKGAEAGNYGNDLRSVVRSVSLQIKVDKWLIARSAPNRRSAVLAAQSKFAMAPIYNRYPGPNLNALQEALRLPGGGFSKAGQEQLAHLWYQSIASAEALSRKYQKESLLYYFK